MPINKLKTEWNFRKIRTLNEILSIKEIEPQRCLLIGKNASNTGFTPWFEDENGYWIGIVRWYGRNSKSFKIDYRYGGKKMWKYCRKMPILPKTHPIRISIEKMERECNARSDK